METMKVEQMLDLGAHKKLWNIAWDMWDHRNGILHHADRPRNDILESAINDQVRQLFRQGVQAVP